MSSGRGSSRCCRIGRRRSNTAWGRNRPIEPPSADPMNRHGYNGANRSTDPIRPDPCLRPIPPPYGRLPAPRRNENPGTGHGRPPVSAALHRQVDQRPPAPRPGHPAQVRRPKYEDPATSSRVYAVNRAEFRRLLDDAAVGDTIRIAAAARLFRSTKDVIPIRDVLKRRGLHLYIATGAWSSGRPPLHQDRHPEDAPQQELGFVARQRLRHQRPVAQRDDEHHGDGAEGDQHRDRAADEPDSGQEGRLRRNRVRSRSAQAVNMVSRVAILPSRTVMMSMPRAAGSPLGPNAQARAPSCGPA